MNCLEIVPNFKWKPEHKKPSNGVQCRFGLCNVPSIHCLTWTCFPFCVKFSCPALNLLWLIGFCLQDVFVEVKLFIFCLGLAKGIGTCNTMITGFLILSK